MAFDAGIEVESKAHPPGLKFSTDAAAMVQTQVPARIGLAHMLLSCACFSLAGSFVYQASLTQPSLQPILVSGVRVIINLSFVVGMALLDRDLRGLLGDGRPSLWWRGLFGTFALMLSFASIAAIGVGESSFLQSSSAIFVGLLAPRVLKVSNPSGVWVALAAGLVGVALLSHPRLDDLHPNGRMFGLGSGVLAALAYLMIARAGRSNPPRTVIFYFSLVGLAVHGIALTALQPIMPASAEVWSYVLMAGICATFGQHYLTRAYQEAPAAWNAIASYSGPVMSFVIGVVWFGNHPDGLGIAGAMLIVGSGIAVAAINHKRPRAKIAAAGANR